MNRSKSITNTIHEVLGSNQPDRVFDLIDWEDISNGRALLKYLNRSNRFDQELVRQSLAALLTEVTELGLGNPQQQKIIRVAVDIYSDTYPAEFADWLNRESTAGGFDLPSEVTGIPVPVVSPGDDLPTVRR